MKQRETPRHFQNEGEVTICKEMFINILPPVTCNHDGCVNHFRGEDVNDKTSLFFISGFGIRSGHHHHQVSNKAVCKMFDL